MQLKQQSVWQQLIEEDAIEDPLSVPRKTFPFQPFVQGLFKLSDFYPMLDELTKFENYDVYLGGKCTKSALQVNMSSKDYKLSSSLKHFSDSLNFVVFKKK